MTSHPGKTEHGEQEALYQWAEVMVATGQYPELHLMHAVPNWRPKESERIYLAAEGVKANIPDNFLPVARRGFHGMYIELKIGKNQPTKGQITMHEALWAQGYYVLTCWGFEHAQSTIINYLELD